MPAPRGDRVSYRKFVRPYLDGASLLDVAQAERVDVATVLMVLARERVVLRRRALQDLPQKQRLAFARLVHAEFARTGRGEVITKKYGITKEQLRSLIATARAGPRVEAGKKNDETMS